MNIYMKEKKKDGGGLKIAPSFAHRPDLYARQQVVSKSLEGKVVVVEPCYPATRKQSLELLVIKHGGKVQYN